jgi:hypothetical protein
MGQADTPEKGHPGRVQHLNKFYRCGEGPEMKIRKEAIILGIVIVALSLYLIFNKGDRSLYELPDLEPILSSKISKMTLDSSEGSIVFTRKAGGWVINEEAYPGDETNIKRVIDIVANLKLTTLISESRNYGRYDLDPDHAITVKAWEGDKLVREFDVGKTASGQRHTFVKLADDYRVYHAGEGFRNRVQGNLDMFRNKTVMSFEPDKIDQVQVSNKDAQGIFVKEKTPQAAGETPADGDTPGMKTIHSVWRNAAGKVVKESKLTKLIDDFSSLKCRAFVYDRQKADFTDPVAMITFKGAEEYTLQIFDRLEEDASEYPAISSQNDYLFIVPKWQADQVINALADIAEPEKENATTGE